MQRDVALEANCSALSTFDSLLGALYRGVTAPDGFQMFIELLAASFKLRSVTLIQRNDSNREIEALWAHGITQPWLEKYALQYAAEDIVARHIHAMPIGQFYASNLDLPHPEQIPLSRFFREWLDPQDIRCVAGCIVQREGQWCTELFVQRGPEHPLFSGLDMHELNALLPHLEQAIFLRQKFVALQVEQNFLCASFDMVARPVFFFDEQCRVSYLNCSAEQFLAANPTLSIEDGHLIVADPRASRVFRFAVGAAIQISRSDASSLTTVVRLPRSGRLPLVLMISPLRLNTAVGLNAGALVFGFDPEATSEMSAATVRKLFELTDAEAALAVALCSGRTLDEIATQRNVTLHTIKSQLKTLFAKTGTSRQAELVAKLLGSPAGFLLPLESMA